jgi:hypothetical protein
VTRLALALFLTGTFFLGRASAGAADTDATAIASFLSIGLANASTKFSALTGAEDGFQAFKATQWPDHTHFDKCDVYHGKSMPAVHLPENDSYACYSTLRADPTEALFKMAEAAVRASLPSGYTSIGAQVHPPGQPFTIYEVWSRPGSPDVKLWSSVNQGTAPDYGKADYELAVDVRPIGAH